MLKVTAAITAFMALKGHDAFPRYDEPLMYSPPPVTIQTDDEAAISKAQEKRHRKNQRRKKQAAIQEGE